MPDTVLEQILGLDNALRDAKNKKPPELLGGASLSRPVTDLGQRGQVAVNGHVGLELEVEGRNLPNAADVQGIVGRRTDCSWTAIADGSLRGESREYVLQGVADILDVRHLVSGLFKAFSDRGTVLHNSNRCSTHVHVNVSKLKANQLTSVIVLWNMFADVFIEWWGEDRKNNHFCLTSKQEEGTIQAWKEFLSEGHRAHRMNDGLKYSSLNILPIWTLGSVEFRCGGAPDDANQVVFWAKICNALVKVAAERYATPTRLSYALSEIGAVELLREIIDAADLGEKYTEMVWDELQKSDITRLAYDGFRNVQELVAEFPWEALEEAFARAYVVNPFER